MMKYVRHKDFGIWLFPISSSNRISHRTIAYRPGRDKIISAGFAELKNNQFVCFGRSESLNMESGESDTDLLNSQFQKKEKPQ
ncbi:MAG TPA: hypothetical protein ENH82_12805 [bacterium]|nr:hypothetical protein [bacterium]